MEGQQLLILRWCSVSWWGREHFTFSFADKDSQLVVYDYVQPIAYKITHDTWPRIIDASLTLIFMMGQGACYHVFCLYKPPTLRLWLRATYRPADYPDTWPRIVDALLTLIFMMRQEALYGLCCQWRQPILRLWQFATYCTSDYPRYKTKNDWCSVDDHFHTGAGSA